MKKMCSNKSLEYIFLLCYIKINHLLYKQFQQCKGNSFSILFRLYINQFQFHFQETFLWDELHIYVVNNSISIRIYRKYTII